MIFTGDKVKYLSVIPPTTNNVTYLLSPRLYIHCDNRMVEVSPHKAVGKIGKLIVMPGIDDIRHYYVEFEHPARVRISSFKQLEKVHDDTPVDNLNEDSVEDCKDYYIKEVRI